MNLLEIAKSDGTVTKLTHGYAPIAGIGSGDWYPKRDPDTEEYDVEIVTHVEVCTVLARSAETQPQRSALPTRMPSSVVLSQPRRI